MITALSIGERDAALESLSEWRFDWTRNAIYRNFRFADFSSAFAFMTRAALAAEKADHHPEWSNVYDRVEVFLTTHDAGGVSSRDIAMATTMDAIVAG